MFANPEWNKFNAWCEDFCRKNNLSYHYLFSYYGDGDTISINGVQFHQCGYIMVSEAETIHFKRSYSRMKDIINAMFLGVQQESDRIAAESIY